MKILFYSHTSQVSGAEKILLLLLEKLNRSRFSPRAVCSGDGPLRKSISAMNVPCRSTAELSARFTVNPVKLLTYLKSVVNTALSLRHEALEDRPDVIHANSIRAGLVATAATMGTQIPVFWHLQDELGTHPISTLIRIFVLVTKRVRLVAASGQTLKSFRGWLLNSTRIANRSRVIYNVVDSANFQFSEEARTRIRDEINAKDDEFLFGVIGQITPRKGQREVLRTFKDCLHHLPKAKLLIIGEPMFNTDSEYLDELKQFVLRQGLSDSVKFLGFRDDVPEILSALDTVVINSSSEAFVVVGIEGLSTGVPVIATDVGGIREMLVHDENGLIVSFGDAGELASAMVRMGKDAGLREKFIRNGRHVVKEKLNAKVFANAMEEFFETAGERAVQNSIGQIKDAESNA